MLKLYLEGNALNTLLIRQSENGWRAQTNKVEKEQKYTKENRKKEQINIKMESNETEKEKKSWFFGKMKKTYQTENALTVPKNLGFRTLKMVTYQLYLPLCCLSLLCCPTAGPNDLIWKLSPDKFSRQSRELSKSVLHIMQLCICSISEADWPLIQEHQFPFPGFSLLWFLLVCILLFFSKTEALIAQCGPRK